MGQILTGKEFEMEQVIYDELQALARAHKSTDYTEMGALVGLEPHDSRLWAMLDEINRFEHEHKRPMISALVIARGERNQRTDKPIGAVQAGAGADGHGYFQEAG